MQSTTTDQQPECAAKLQVTWLLQQAEFEPAHSLSAWSWLEAAHIVGQTHLFLHARVHQSMYARALQERKWREVWAQLLRLALIPAGHLLKRLPLGNPGSSRVGALTPMPIPEHLATLIMKSRENIKAGSA